jgi:hypothetical protein
MYAFKDFPEQFGTVFGVAEKRVRNPSGNMRAFSSLLPLTACRLQIIRFRTEIGAADG